MTRGSATAAAGAALFATGLLSYGVRGRSAQLFGPSVFRGPRHLPLIALTFDDGPSETTPALLELLGRYNVSSTFFQCGANVRRLPGVAREVLAAGHEIGNHSDSHTSAYFRSTDSIFWDFQMAQHTIVDVTGFRPRLLRAPFGVRWFGFAETQRRLELLGVMWSVIGRDWKLGAAQIAARVLRSASPGAIVCLHDGRELALRPDIRSTLDALRLILPALQDSGFRFRTVSQLLNAGS